MNVTPELAISVGLIVTGGVGAYWKVKSCTKTNKEDIKELGEDVKEKLSEKEHKILCKNAALELKAHVSQTMADFTRDVFQPSIDSLIKEIKKTNGGSNT